MASSPQATRPSLPPRERAVVMMGIVRRIARRISRRLPRSVRFDDLMSAGALGLAEAYSRRGAMSGNEFEKFASCRIYGAILDELRTLDPLTRGLRRVARALDASEGTDEYRTVAHHDEDAASHLGVEAKVVREVQVRRQVHESPESTQLSDPSAPSPEDIVVSRDAFTKLFELASQMPPSQQRVFTECYVHRRSQNEVAKLLGVSKPRVSQIHSELVQTLTSMFAGDGEARRAA